ncbi:hypothetical protein T05_1873 [Trichinella murrelli]|uniref:Uncharacterized protein n=1 Tax=Trichinella murrelli TaxID=144512 RepID=A0A0V0U2Z0_9BILA|nr:hypothetical protein T05_1873 [Trichinella murrelli]
MKTKKTEATGELASCQPIPARRQIAMDAPIPRWKKRTSLLEAAARYIHRPTTKNCCASLDNEDEEEEQSYCKPTGT